MCTVYPLKSDEGRIAYWCNKITENFVVEGLKVGGIRLLSLFALFLLGKGRLSSVASLELLLLPKLIVFSSFLCKMTKIEVLQLI